MQLLSKISISIKSISIIIIGDNFLGIFFQVNKMQREQMFELNHYSIMQKQVKMESGTREKESESGSS